MPLHLVEHRWLQVTQVSLLCLALASGSSTASALQAPRVSRVRSENPLLAATIGRGVDQSPMFRRLIEAIDTTDGLVYIIEGKCGEGVRACLHMSLELAGPYRLLRILVNPRRAPGCELIPSIGHELQHALEALGNPRIKTSAGLSSFFHQIGPEGPRRFDTTQAVQVGLAVKKEACKRRETVPNAP